MILRRLMNAMCTESKHAKAMTLQALAKAFPVVAALCGLVACGGDDPPVPAPDPTIASLTLKAGSGVNPNDSGEASPVVVRVYQLTNATYFKETDFFQLQEDAASALGDELVTTEDFVLAPGQTVVYQRELQDGVRFVGITAAFRDLSAGQWRSFHPIPAAKTSLLEAEITGTEVAIRKAGL